MRLVRICALAGLAVAACLSTACAAAPPGEVRSASAQRACAAAATASHDAAIVVAALRAIGVPEAKLAPVAAEIDRGERVITAACQVIAPQGVAQAGEGPVQPVT